MGLMYAILSAPFLLSHIYLSFSLLHNFRFSSLNKYIQIFAIFSNIEVILNCHKKLLDMFEKRLVVWDSSPELGDIFLENTAFIKLYKYYVNNFDKSIITLKTVREKNPEFQKFAQV